MKIRNATNEMRSTWTGQDVNPGDVFDASALPENEIEWLLRHGFKEVKATAKPKPGPVKLEEVMDTPTVLSPPPPTVPRFKRGSRRTKKD